MLSADADGNSTIDLDKLASQVLTSPAAPLSTTDAASLLLMREGEQLAHHVHAAGATQWAQAIFANSMTSEATHSAAVKKLIDRFQLVDPLAGLPTVDKLLRCSRNHLRAFMRALTQQGGSDVPECISQAEFDAIVTTPFCPGR